MVSKGQTYKYLKPNTMKKVGWMYATPAAMFIFAYLMTVGAINVTGHTGDIICGGNITCDTRINFTMNLDYIYLQANSSWYMAINDTVRDLKFYVRDKRFKTGWREINLSEPSPYCQRAGCKYAYRFYKSKGLWEVRYTFTKDKYSTLKWSFGYWVDPLLVSLKELFSVEHAKIDGKEARKIKISDLLMEKQKTKDFINKMQITDHVGSGKAALKVMQNVTKTKNYSYECNEKIVTYLNGTKKETRRETDICHSTHTYVVEELVDIKDVEYLDSNSQIYEVFDDCDKIGQIGLNWGCKIWTEPIILSETVENATWFNNSWTYRIPVYVNQTGSTNLTDFPTNFTYDTQALIIAGKMNGSCKDIRFAELDGTVLNFTFEGHDNDTFGCNTTATQMFFRTDILVGNVTRYMYYGNPTAAFGNNTAGTFNDDYGAVHLMSDKSGNATDATSNDRQQAPSGNPVYQIRGLFGNAIHCDGTGDRFTRVDYVNMTDGGTIEARVNFRTLDTNNRASGVGGQIFDGATSNDNGIGFYYTVTQIRGCGEVVSGGSRTRTTGLANDFNTSQWYYLAVQWNSTNSSVSYFVDGELVNTAGSASYANPSQMQLCVYPYSNYGQNQHHGDLYMDDFKYSSVERSSDWILRSYRQDLISTGAEETMAAQAPTVVLNNPPDNSYNNTNPIFFQYTPTTTDDFANCSLYGNFTGTWAFNQSNSSAITNNTINQFNLTLDDDRYLWNVECCSLTSDLCNMSASNFSFTLDTVKPVITIQSPTNTTIRSKSVWFNVTLNEPGNACVVDYGLGNQSLTNSSGNWNLLNNTMNTTTRTAIFYCNDSTGNLNSTNVTFRVETPASFQVFDFNISDFTISSSVPTEIVNVTINTSQTPTALAWFTAMNCERLSGVGDTVLDAQVYLDSVLFGQGTICSSPRSGTITSGGLEPPTLVALTTGNHTIQMFFNASGGAMSVTNVDISLVSSTDNDESIIGGSGNDTYVTFSNTGFEQVWNFTSNETAPSPQRTTPSYTNLQLHYTLNASAQEWAYLYIQNLDTGKIFNIGEVYMSTSSARRSISVLFHDDSDLTTEIQNYTIYAKTRTGNSVTIDGNSRTTANSDTKGNVVQGFGASNTSTNLTSDLSLTAGTYLLINHSINISNGTYFLLQAHASWNSSSGKQVGVDTPRIFVNISNETQCSQKYRSLTDSLGSDVGVVYLFAFCNNLSGTVYPKLWVEVQTGQTLNIIDENLFGLEAVELDVTTGNLAPIAGEIVNPTDGEGVYQEEGFINWTEFVDPNGDVVTYNVTLRNADDLSLNATINGSTTFLYTPVNWTEYAQDVYKLYVEGCDPSDLCSNHSHTVYVTSSGNITLLLDGLAIERYYEHGTTANFTATFNNFTTLPLPTICVNVSGIGQINCSVGTVTALWDTRSVEYRFSDNSEEKNFTANGTFDVELWSRMELQAPKINVTGYDSGGFPQNVEFYINGTKVFELVGTINGTRGDVTSFSDESTNITFTVSGAQRKNFTMSKNTTVTGATMNLTGLTTNFTVSQFNDSSISKETQFTGINGENVTYYVTIAKDTTITQGDFNITGLWYERNNKTCSYDATDLGGNPIQEGAYIGGAYNGSHGWFVTRVGSIDHMVEMDVSDFHSSCVTVTNNFTVNLAGNIEDVAINISKSGKQDFIWYTNGSDFVTKINATDGTYIESFDTGQTAEGIAHNGTNFITTDSGSNTYYIFNETFTQVGSVTCSAAVTLDIRDDYWLSTSQVGGSFRRTNNTCGDPYVSVFNFKSGNPQNNIFGGILLDQNTTIAGHLRVGSEQNRKTLFLLNLSSDVKVTIGNTLVFDDTGSFYREEKISNITAYQNYIDNTCLETSCSVPILIVSSSIGNINVTDLLIKYSTTPEDIEIDVGNDLNNDVTITGVFDYSEVVNLNTTAFQEYIDSSNCVGTSCNVPVIVTSKKAGVINVSNIIINYTFNPIESNKTLIQNLLDTSNNYTNITTSVNTSTWGGITIDGLNYTYLGSQNTTVTAWTPGNSTNQSVNIRWSNTSVAFPQHIPYFYPIPWTNESKNVTPYGQSSTVPIFNVTSFAYDMAANISLSLNETLSPDCINITFDTDNSKDGGRLINTTDYPYITTLSYGNSQGLWSWVDYSCPATPRWINATFVFKPCCILCVPCW